MSSLALSFNEVKFNPVPWQDGQIWLSSGELAQALGYKQENAVSKIFNRNSDEFTKNMTQIIDNPRIPNLGMRIFSLRGCHLIAMFARTAVAKQFRKWVLDILDKEVGAPVARTHKSERTPLHDAHALLVAKTKHLNSSEAWKIINQRFGTNHIDEIPYDMIPVAVEYVHHLIAMYSSAEKKAQGSLFNEDHFKLLKDLIDAIISQNYVTSKIYRAIHMLNNEQGCYLAEYAFKTNIAVLKLTRAMGLTGPNNRKIISDDLKTISYTTGNQHYGDRWFHPLMESSRLMGVLEISGSLIRH